jgi:Dolichyl-phosphate-mannose-protein mannosyltransferase
LFDPPWVNDEGTYFAVAQSMAHGYRLYADVWENKPPGLYLLYRTVYQGVGPSLFTIRVIASVAVLGIVLLSFALGRRLAGNGVGLVASALVGMLFGVPFLEGTTGNAELFLAFFAALGVYLVVARQSPWVGGVALGISVMFKAVGGFDVIALALWLWLRKRRQLPLYLTGVGTVFAAAALAAQLTGVLSPMIHDALLYDLGYVGQGNGSGVPWLVVAKITALGAVSIALRNRPFPNLWLAYTAAGALLSGRIFGHYLLQVVVPLALSLALCLRERPSMARRLLPIVPLTFASIAVLTTAVGWAMATSGHDSILARRLQWYANFGRLALRRESYPRYREQVDDHVSRNIRVADAISQLPPGRLLVWGNAPWVYVLSSRLPTTPYTSASRSPQVPGETAALRASVLGRKAKVVVVYSPPMPSLGAAGKALSRFYRPISHVEKATIYVSIR